MVVESLRELTVKSVADSADRPEALVSLRMPVAVRMPVTDRLGKTDEKKSEFRLQYTYYISIESSQRALSIAVPCVFSRAHSASISPDHFSAASSENVCTSL